MQSIKQFVGCWNESERKGGRQRRRQRNGVGERVRNEGTDRGLTNMCAAFVNAVFTPPAAEQAEDVG